VLESGVVQSSLLVMLSVAMRKMLLCSGMSLALQSGNFLGFCPFLFHFFVIISVSCEVG